MGFELRNDEPELYQCSFVVHVGQLEVEVDSGKLGCTEYDEVVGVAEGGAHPPLASLHGLDRPVDGSWRPAGAQRLKAPSGGRHDGEMLGSAPLRDLTQ